MKIRLFVLSLVWTASLFAQKKFDFQEACFRNNALPYCAMRDFVIKPTPKGKGPTYGISAAGVPPVLAPGDIDWRFADPQADAVAALKGGKLSASPIAHALIEQLGASQGLTPAEVQKVFRALSDVNQVALSVRDGRIVLLVTGRDPDSILPALETGWKSTPLGGNTMLIGHKDAVDQAAQRLSVGAPTDGLASMAEQREDDSEFWAAGIAKLATKEAVAAGAKRFSVTASLRDKLNTDTAFEFDDAPDPTAIRTWLNTLTDAKLEGDAVHIRSSFDADKIRQSFAQIAASPLGQRLGALIQSARYLPVRDTATTQHTKPVIYGLDDGPREVK